MSIKDILLKKKNAGMAQETVVTAEEGVVQVSMPVSLEAGVTPKVEVAVKRGRPALNGERMSAAEYKRRWRAKQKAS